MKKNHHWEMLRTLIDESLLDQTKTATILEISRSKLSKRLTQSTFPYIEQLAFARLFKKDDNYFQNTIETREKSISITNMWNYEYGEFQSKQISMFRDSLQLARKEIIDNEYLWEIITEKKEYQQYLDEIKSVIEQEWVSYKKILQLPFNKTVKDHSPNMLRREMNIRYETIIRMNLQLFKSLVTLLHEKDQSWDNNFELSIVYDSINTNSQVIIDDHRINEKRYTFDNKWNMYCSNFQILNDETSSLLLKKNQLLQDKRKGIQVTFTDLLFAVHQVNTDLEKEKDQIYNYMNELKNTKSSVINYHDMLFYRWIGFSDGETVREYLRKLLHKNELLKNEISLKHKFIWSFNSL